MKKSKIIIVMATVISLAAMAAGVGFWIHWGAGLAVGGLGLWIDLQYGK